MRDNLEIIRNMGLGWTAFRLKYEIEKKLGKLQKQFPAFLYEDFDLHSRINSNESILQLLKESRKCYFFNNISNAYKQMTNVFQTEKAIAEADEICNGTFRYFSCRTFQYDELNWHYNPDTKKTAPTDKHWSIIADLGSDFGDIKWIWELSRFSFVYPLVRAYAAVGDDKYVETFWSYFEDFIKKNPPELGPNYKCGQEMSFRLMAWTFGLFAFLEHPASSKERLELMMKAIYHHADHVDKHIEFALKSVKNNHSISESVGIYTVGILFPFFDKANRWMKRGKKFIQSEAMWQIYEDGSYIQHSMNYQRLVIQDLTWAVRLGQINNDLFDEAFLNRFSQTVRFMYQHQELTTGKMPNYGMNDGAYIHPLTSCEYLDHRPALQAAWYILNNELLYKNMDVNEIAYWLIGSECTNAKISSIKQKSQDYSKGGYYLLRNDNSFGMIRCTSYKHRPAQADMLHFDLWYKQKNILADAGTFSYNTDMDHILYFNGTSSHNTIMANNKDQMKKASRFIWLNWTKSKMLRFNHKEFQVFEGEHYGYGGVTHRRGIIQYGSYWVVIDDLFGRIDNDSVSLSWLFGIQNVEQLNQNELIIGIEGEHLKVKTYSTQSYTANLYKGSLKPLRGWRSLYYGNKEIYPQLVIESIIKEPTRFITIIGPDRENIYPSIADGKLIIDSSEININDIGNTQIFNLK
ncbi:alginate lyase family protein [Lederbergia citrea]|uniref:alginate lyase family protein n=1 Tax=Lederbergia citrea TaxID=2833581 RepID=UPI001BC971A5|nr:alginate lyase family protein [Lederbergia citrea]MBS4204804.1 alginate lyase family protein [Lederbergia citrea]